MDNDHSLVVRQEEYLLVTGEGYNRLEFKFMFMDA